MESLIAEAERVAAELDPALLAPRDAERLLAQATTLRNIADGLCTLLAPRATESGRWRRDGARTESEWLARKLGVSDGAAATAIATGRRLQALPATAGAVRSGRLSTEQAAAVADGAAADPTAEERLLALAARDSLRGLHQERDKVKAAADPDPEARYRRIHRERRLRTWTDGEGAGCGSWRTTPDQQAAILAAVRRFQDEGFEAARVSGAHESSEAYAVDGLAAMAAAAMGAGRAHRVVGVGSGGVAADRAGAVAPRAKLPAKAIVRIDHAALVRGSTEPGETCEIAGVGPVPVSLVREYVASGDVFLAAIVTKGVDVCTVAHLGRKPRACQVTAMQWRDATCRIEGCPRPPAEWDHHDDWAATHETRLWDLGGLCAHDHDLKTNKGYRMVPGTLPGKYRLIPPDDS